MKHLLLFGLALVLLLAGCAAPAAPGLADYALGVADLPQGFYQSVEEHSLRYLQLLVPEAARRGLVEAYAVGLETGPDADRVRALLFAYRSDSDAAAAFNAIQPGGLVQALPSLGREVYLYEPAGSQGESVVIFHDGVVVGSISARLVSDALGDPRAVAAHLAGVVLERLRQKGE